MSDITVATFMFYMQTFATMDAILHFPSTISYFKTIKMMSLLPNLSNLFLQTTHNSNTSLVLPQDTACYLTIVLREARVQQVKI